MTRMTGIGAGRPAGTIVAVVCALLAAGCRTQREPWVRTTVGQVRALSAEQVQAGVRVRLRTVVTYCDRQMNLFFVEDETGGMRVDSSGDSRSFEPGERLEIAGFVGSGGDSPLIVEPAIRVLSSAPLPAAPVISAAELRSGKFDYRRVTTRGVAHEAAIDSQGRLILTANVDGVKVTVRVLHFPAGKVPDLAGAQVLATGVAGRALDAYGNAVDLRLWIPSLDDVVTEREAIAPASLPVRSVRELEKMARAARPPREQVRVRGRCDRDERDGTPVLDDGTGRIRLQPAGFAEDFPQGDADVVGFLSRRQGTLALDSAVTVIDDAVLAARPPRALATLTNIRRIQHLPAEEARRAYPVHVLATVTYADPALHLLFVQNETGGIYVFAGGGSPALHTGDAVEIEGFSKSGQFASAIGSTAIRKLGRGAMPEPASIDPERVVLGYADSQWVELEGVVEGLSVWARQALVTLVDGSHRFQAHILGVPALPESYRGVRLRLRGVAATQVNPRRQLLGVHLFVPGMEWVKVAQPAPADLFSLPLRSVSSLLRFSPDEPPGAMLHVRGVVTLSRHEGPTWIRGTGGALLIHDHLPVRLAPGDVVDVVGFPVQGPFSPEIRGAIIDKTAGGPAPEPLAITADEAREGLHDAELIQVDAIVEQQVRGEVHDVLYLRAGRTRFTAHIENQPGGAEFAVGALVRVTGICAVEVDSSHEIAAPRGFTMQMRSPGDVRVIRDAPWWTPQRTLRALAFAMGVVILAFVWVAALRRRVHRQTQVIAAKLAAEEALKKAAEAANLAKSEFLANVSHELRTPMNGIVGFTSLALETELSEPQRDYLDTVQTSANSLLQVINDLLDFSRVEAGKLDLEAAEFSLAECLTGAMKVVEPDAARKALRTRCEIAPELPEVLVGDPVRLRQILLNLLSNAVKFTAVGEVLLAAEPASETDAEVRVRIRVSDTGIGIAPEKTALIFEPFCQADGSVTRKYGGTGLGLAICRRLVDLLGGEIGVESCPGGGSTFACVLPFARPQPGRAAPARKTLPQPEAAGPMSILVAEDNAVNMRLVTHVLEARGHRVTPAVNGTEALELYKRGEYDLVLMDVQMPGMDGFEATAAIRRAEDSKRHVPIYAFTAHAMAGDREKCLNAGMDGYVSKPVQLRDLLALIDEVAAKTPAVAQPHREPALS